MPHDGPLTTPVRRYLMADSQRGKGHLTDYQIPSRVVAGWKFLDAQMHIPGGLERQSLVSE